jgi:hypothetical protein
LRVAGIEERINAPPARSHPARKALLRVAEPIQRGEHLAEHGLEFTAAAIVGVDRSDNGALVFLEQAGERLEVGEPLGAARLRRLDESPALRVEARLKFGRDGEVGEGRFGRVHESPLLIVARFASALVGSRRRAATRVNLTALSVLRHRA